MLKTDKSASDSFDPALEKPSASQDLLIGLSALAFGLLSYPIGSPRALDNSLATLGLATIGIVVGIFAISAIWKNLTVPGVGFKRSIDAVLLGGVLLAIAIGNVAHPWLTVALSAVTLGLRSEFLFKDAKERGFTRIVFTSALAAIALSAHGFAYFVHSRQDASAIASVASQETQAAAPGALPTDAQLIDLKPYINVQLNESLFRNRLFDDSFSEVPPGQQTFGGIPFKVDGIVMLTGRLAVKYGSEFPSKVEIKVGSKSERLHFLGGISQEDSHNYGAVVGDITLNYTDGTQFSSKLVVGYNVVNRLGIASESLDDVHSSIVWWGNNGLTASFQKTMPFLKLRLCKTTIINPHPNSEIASVVYESRQLAPSPFFAGLTLD